MMNTPLLNSRLPRGDITTILDLVDRDSQDGYFFPTDEKNSQFQVPETKYHPTTNNIYEVVHKGTADWGGRLTFELDSLTSGDILQGLILQIRLAHWYPLNAIANMENGSQRAVDSSSNPLWTYANGLGNAIIEYAEFEVGDQTLERITGEFIQTYLSLYSTPGGLFGQSIDGFGRGTMSDLVLNQNGFNVATQPWPTEVGQYFCALPFFFMRSRTKGAFPLLSCAEGSVRVHVKLRPFSEMVRISNKSNRTSCTDTPLGKTFIFEQTSAPHAQTAVTGSSVIPQFNDFRILAMTQLCTGTIRSKFLRSPVEQMNQFVQTFIFSEPLKYLTNKTNSSSDTINISLPLELNHPVKELIWVFRRTGVQINNEWYNFSPELEEQYINRKSLTAKVKPWLQYATLRVNGFIVDQADGDWWRWQIANRHRGGIISWSNNIYGYAFARLPDEHQPSGYANMSRAHSVNLNLSVNVPIAVSVPPGFNESVGQGWEVHVFAIHYNWIRFQNALCQKLYSD